MEYYKLSLLLVTGGDGHSIGHESRDIYFSIDEAGQPKILHSDMNWLNGCRKQKLEKVTEEEVHKIMIEDDKSLPTG